MNKPIRKAVLVRTVSFWGLDGERFPIVYGEDGIAYLLVGKKSVYESDDFGWLFSKGDLIILTESKRRSKFFIETLWECDEEKEQLPE